MTIPFRATRWRTDFRYSALPAARPVPNSPDYQLLRKLGAGAFGEVWHAHGPGGIEVALKFIR